MKHQLRLILSFALYCLSAGKTCPANLTGRITCTLPNHGNKDCNAFTMTYSQQCTEQYAARYDFTYCNPNTFSLTINSTVSYLRSEYKNFTWANFTILPLTTSANCYTLSRWSYLQNCDTTTWARMNIVSKSVDNNFCNLFVNLPVNPNIIFPPTTTPSSSPVNKRSKKPTRKPTKRITRSPTKKVTRSPTKKITRVPTKKPTRMSSRKPSRFLSKKPTGKPIRSPTARPSKRPTLSPFRPSRLPSKKPTFNPSKKPTFNPSKKPTIKPRTPTRKPTVAKGPTRKPTRLPTIAPTASICGTTPLVRSNSLTNTVSGLSTAQALTNSSSPQSLALSWLINQDGLKLCPGDSRITQRFSMAVFYFSTGGDSWVGCGRNSVKACTPTLSFVIGDPLVARYGTSTWLSSVDECLWGGLACNNTDGTLDRIEFNRVTANKLQGTLPTEVTLLTNMRYLIIESCCSSSIPSYNTSGYAAIQGTIPSNIGSLQKLFVLDLSYNLMTGTVPSSIVNIPKLKEIDLNSNRFIGTFPSPQNATQLSKLLYVHLESNAFTGTVPSIGNAINLANFTLQANKFSGQMPQAICNLITPPPGGVKVLNNLWADCLGNPPKVTCACCNKCF